MTTGEQEATVNVFRTVYYLAKCNRPFSDHESLIALQKLNGVKLGVILHSRYSSTAIVSHIAAEMRKKVINHIIRTESKVSVLVDEGTSLSSKSVLTVHLKANMGEAPIFIFLDLIELEAQTSVAIYSALLNCLTSHGMSDEFLSANWISFTSDGASVMLGKRSGVSQHLLQKYPRLFIWHCLNHRLELSVADAVEDIVAINHFKAFMDAIYCLYSQSPKNQRGLSNACQELGQQFLRIGRVLSVRWVASSFRSVRAVWISFDSLNSHFEMASADVTRDARERQKFKGLRSRLFSPEFICDLALMYDILQELSSLSLQLQKRSMTLAKADAEIKRSIRVLLSFKENPGDKLEEALRCKEAGCYSKTNLIPNPKMKCIPRNQLIQSLADNMNRRLCDASEVDMLNSFSVLDKTTWPETRTIRYGEREVRQLCKRFNIDEEESVRGMRAFVDGESAPEGLTALNTAVKTIPCSTAECERDISLMNIICNELRTRILTENIASLMFININGPPLDLWKPHDYVQSWLLNHRSANDTRSRTVQETPIDNDDRLSLWQLL
jgi:hypothetical protein